MHNLLMSFETHDSPERRAGRLWALYPPGDMLWDPELEAHPLNPMASWSSKDGKSQGCAVAMGILESLKKQASETAETPVQGVLPELGQVDDGTLSALVGTLKLDDLANPMSTHVQHGENWLVYSKRVLKVITLRLDLSARRS